MRQSTNYTYRQTRFEAMAVISWFSRGTQQRKQVDDCRECGVVQDFLCFPLRGRTKSIESRYCGDARLNLVVQMIRVSRPLTLTLGSQRVSHNFNHPSHPWVLPDNTTRKYALPLHNPQILNFNRPRRLLANQTRLRQQVYTPPLLLPRTKM